MPATRTSRLLLVALAVLGLALAVPVVGAHGNATTSDEAPPSDADADDWAEWMTAHMTAHMGPGSLEWMADHMGLTVEEMAEAMARGDVQHPYDSMHPADHPYDSMHPADYPYGDDRPYDADRPADRPYARHGC